MVVISYALDESLWERLKDFDACIDFLDTLPATKETPIKVSGITSLMRKTESAKLESGKVQPRSKKKQSLGIFGRKKGDDELGVRYTKNSQINLFKPFTF